VKVPSTSSIRRSLAAVSFAAVVALAGCTGSDDPTGSGASDGGGPAAAPERTPFVSDGGGEQAAPDQAAPEADVSDVPDVVATVNGEEITREEFVPVYETQFQQLAMQQQATGEEVDQTSLKQQTAEQLVGNELLQQGAAAAGIEPAPEEIDAFLEDTAAQSGMGSVDELIQTLEQQGMTEEEIRADATTQVQITTFVEQETDIAEPSEEELQAQYDQMVAQQSQAGGDSSQIPPFEEVRDQLAQQAMTQQQNEAANQLAAELREAGDVTVNL
jgi:peptidyl-prolyl cis-trans isomerase SurA